MATWISDDGSIKIETISTDDKGQWIEVDRWCSSSYAWVKSEEIRIPQSACGRKLSFREQVNWLARKISKYGIELVQGLVEVDDPYWEDEAMNVKDGQPTS